MPELESEYKRVRWLLEHGVFDVNEDECERLLAMLNECETIEQIESVHRTALRWEYATQPLPEWYDTETFIVASRN